jgi:xanthine/CO dehydrogenase XdhC/CoxF family maturation factor
LTEFDINARVVSGYRTRLEAIEKRLAEVEPVNEPRREDRGREDHSTPHQGGDRLNRVEVVFEVASERYPLDEQAATLMAENLRVKAAHEPGAEGTVGARAVADAIELRLIEDTADPITLGGDGAEAVFYALSLPTGGSAQPRALYDAVKRLHEEWIR